MTSRFQSHTKPIASVVLVWTVDGVNEILFSFWTIDSEDQMIPRYAISKYGTISLNTATRVAIHKRRLEPKDCFGPNGTLNPQAQTRCCLSYCWQRLSDLNWQSDEQTSQQWRRGGLQPLVTKKEELSEVTAWWIVETSLEDNRAKLQLHSAKISHRIEIPTCSRAKWSEV